MSESDTFQKDTERYCEWLQENLTSVSPKVEIRDFRSENQGRGVVATNDIEEGEVLFSIPRTAILNVETSALSQEGEAKRVLMRLPQWEALILCLAHELSLPDSKWEPYLAVLPKTSNTLMFWKEVELKDLVPSYVVSRIGKADAEKMYERVAAVAQELNVDSLKHLSLEQFHIVASIILSYSFDVEHPGKEDEDVDAEENLDDNFEEVEDTADEEEEDEQEQGDDAEEEEVEEESEDHSMQEAEEEEQQHTITVSEDDNYKSMVPFADTLNADTKLCNANLNYESTHLVMKATKRIAKGEQIYNTYGEHPNSEILRRYGYIERDGSKYDFGEVSLSDIQRHFSTKYPFYTIEALQFTAEVIARSQYLIENLESEESIISDTYECYYDGEVVPEVVLLLLILTVLSLSGEEDTKWFKKMIRQAKRASKTSEFEKFINRTILKCHQLTAQNKVTQITVENYREVLATRMLEYPEFIRSGVLPYDLDGYVQSRAHLAAEVLVSEYRSLETCHAKALSSLEAIPDVKMVKNVLKRKLEEEHQSNKRHKRTKA